MSGYTTPLLTPAAAERYTAQAVAAPALIAVEIYHNESGWYEKYAGTDRADELRKVYEFRALAQAPHAAILETTFFAFNVGDDPEFTAGQPLLVAQEYRAKELRSLSVGDVVKIDGARYRCASLGWDGPL